MERQVQHLYIYIYVCCTEAGFNQSKFVIKARSLENLRMEEIPIPREEEGMGKGCVA